MTHDKQQLPKIGIHKYGAVGMEYSQINKLIRHERALQCILQLKQMKKDNALASHPAFRGLDEPKIDAIVMLVTVRFKHSLWAIGLCLTDQKNSTIWFQNYLLEEVVPLFNYF